MTLRQFTINANIISSGKHCRLDPKYTCFTQVQDWKVFETKIKQVKLSELLVELPLIKVSKGQLEEETILVNISDQEQNSGELKNLEKTDEIGSDKNSLVDADIFISKLGMPKGYVFVNTYKGKNIIGSSEFIPYRLLDIDYLMFLKYLLINKKMLIAYSSLESGKTPSHKRVNPYEFLKIKIPLLPKPAIKKIATAIEPFEKKIRELKTQIIPQHEIINKVFSRELSFNLIKFEELKKIKNYQIDLSNCANNKDLRNGVIFHRKSSQFVMSELKKVTKAKIKHFNAEPIVLGASISPSDFNENGEYYYVSMATIKNYTLELDESQLVSDIYSKKNLNKSIIKNDIIMTRSGVAIGKFALIEEDIKGIFADFTMRIRLKNYNPYFAYYYFRSEYFQHLIHTNKKGLQNKNIFPSQIQELPMIDIDLQKQQKIVDEIKAELDKQEEIKNQIGIERNKIDEIIEKAIA